MWVIIIVIVIIIKYIKWGIKNRGTGAPAIACPGRELAIFTEMKNEYYIFTRTSHATRARVHDVLRCRRRRRRLRKITKSASTFVGILSRASFLSLIIIATTPRLAEYRRSYQDMTHFSLSLCA